MLVVLAVSLLGSIIAAHWLLAIMQLKMLELDRQMNHCNTQLKQWRLMCFKIPTVQYKFIFSNKPNWYTDCLDPTKAN